MLMGSGLNRRGNLVILPPVPKIPRTAFCKPSRIRRQFLAAIAADNSSGQIEIQITTLGSVARRHDGGRSTAGLICSR